MYYLIEDVGLDKKDVRIFWKRGVVQVKGKEVVRIAGHCSITAGDEAIAIKERVERDVAGWYDSRA